MIVRILKADKGLVVSGEVIAQVDTEATATTAAVVPAYAPAVIPAQAGTQPSSSSPRQSPPVMPAAPKLAADKGIDPAKIQGSRRDGRVTKGDVLEHVGRAASYVAVPEAVPAAPAHARVSLQQPPTTVNIDQVLANRPEQRVPMSRLRAHR